MIYTKPNLAFRRLLKTFSVIALFVIPANIEVLSVIAASQASEKPNILVILVDDMGYSDLGCYGSEIATPRLDQLAAEGIRYTQMHNTAKCFPTRACLITGSWFQQSDREFPNTATAGEVLRPAGYDTWWSGKHHANFNPRNRGFDHFSGFLGGAVSFWNPGGEKLDGTKVPGILYNWAFDDKIIKPFIPQKVFPDKYKGDHDFHCTDAFTDWALKWLKDSAAAKQQGQRKPFFLYMAYNAPHWPLHAHKSDIAKFKGLYDVGYAAIRNARYKRQLAMGMYDPKTAPLSAPNGGSQENWDALSKDEQKRESLLMSIHAAMVHQVDRNVGRLVDQLEKMGELENTLIIFLSDNGASSERPNKPYMDENAEPGTIHSFPGIGKNWANVSCTPLRYWKAKNHQGGINTSMIAYWPKGISNKMQGQFYHEPCHLIDWMPTWQAMAGASFPGESKEKVNPLEGVSMLPSFTGASLGRKKPIFFEWGNGRAVRDGKWKLVTESRDEQSWELYDMSLDLTETNDLASLQPERMANMVKAWHAWYQRCTGKPYPQKKVKNKKKNKGEKKGEKKKKA